MTLATRIAKIKTPVKILAGLALGALLIAGTAVYFSPNSAGAPANQLSSKDLSLPPLSPSELEGWPELQHPLAPIDYKPEQAKLGSRLSEEDMAFIRGPEMVGFHWTVDHRGMVVALPTDGVLYDVPSNPVAGGRLSEEQAALAQHYDVVGILWTVDDQGRVVEVPIDGVLYDTPRKPIDGSPSASGQTQARSEYAPYTREELEHLEVLK
jgi:hypothetical protein